ncbi:MAG: hypothetical protein WC208_08565 [Gallionella sp.]|jgi:hypothetical protein
MDPQKLQTIIAIVAGCLGALTGTISLIISLHNWRKARPKLEIRVNQSDHWINNTWVKYFPETGTPHSEFNVRLCIRNTGRESSAVSDPTYSITYEGKRWNLGGHFNIEEDPRIPPDDETARLCKSVIVPGRGFIHLYIKFNVPVGIREDISATLGLLDGDGRYFQLPVVSRWLYYERPEIHLTPMTLNPTFNTDTP